MTAAHANGIAAPAHIFARGDHVELGAALVTRLGGRNDLVFDELHPWQFDDERGLWAKVDPAVESRIVQGFAGYPKASGEARIRIKASDVAGAIKLAHDQVARPGFFASAAGVAFSDCFVRATANGLEVKPHDRENRARAGYRFKYERGPLPRRFLTFLSGLFRDDDDRCEKELFVQEFFGACVLGIAPRYQRCAIGVGEGDNGKSALASIALDCMPPGTTSAIPPQNWGHEYYRALLVGKHSNVIGELPDRELIASEAFKSIVAGDPIVGRTIRESPLMFRPIAGHYFAANRLPGTSDQSEGFWRRFLVLTFNRSFKGDPARDPHIVESVLEERPAIVGWMLAGAERLIRAREYTIPASHHAALAEWRKNADQVALFVESETRALKPDEPLTFGTSAADLYAAYDRWTKTNGHRAMASNKFGMRVRELGHCGEHTRVGTRYPLALLSHRERAERDGRDGLVTDFSGGPSRESREVSRA